MDDKTVRTFASLFAGRTDAYGTGKGQWVKQAPLWHVYRNHLLGRGPGLGIAPLLDNGTVNFAAIDLDEPDFEAAFEMADFIPSKAWVEKSRSGNAHVWVFFNEPIDAWLVRGIMKEAILAAGKSAVEIFPKQDFLRDGMVGNYINLPYHGESRPVVCYNAEPYPLGKFLNEALENRSDIRSWQRRGKFLLIEPPETRHESGEFGAQKELHMCAEWIIANRDENPVTEGHRAVVFFSLAKMLSNWESSTPEESLRLMELVNESSPDPVDSSELKRILNNVQRGEFKSTGCDDPLMAPYVHPDCKIAHGT